MKTVRSNDPEEIYDYKDVKGGTGDKMSET